MNLAAWYDITIEEGTTFSMTFEWRDSSGSVIDFSSYDDVRMDIRPTKESSTLIASSEGATPGIVIDVTDAATGIFIVNMTATVTAAFDFHRAVYDIEAFNTPTVYRLMEGNVTLSREASRTITA